VLAAGAPVSAPQSRSGEGVQQGAGRAGQPVEPGHFAGPELVERLAKPDASVLAPLATSPNTFFAFGLGQLAHLASTLWPSVETRAYPQTTVSLFTYFIQQITRLRLRSFLYLSSTTRINVFESQREIVKIPNGFAQVFPYIFVEDAISYILFLTAGFGAVEVGRTTGSDGRIANARVRFGSATLMVSEASAAYPPSKAALYLYVSDVVAVMSSAIGAGAKLEMQVADTPYGDRQGGVTDPAGNIWWISQRVSDEPYDLS